MVSSYPTAFAMADRQSACATTHTFDVHVAVLCQKDGATGEPADKTKTDT